MARSAKSTNAQTVTILAKVQELRCDPVQYKPTAPTLLPEDMWVEVQIDSTWLIRTEGTGRNKRRIFAPDAIAVMSKVVQTAMMRQTLSD